ncbi:MAG: hypothetical protein KGI25_00745 [Thaumarchaeota archaeon]|nr:hypothetical protein [Nitrososphaerota archaeon]
MSKHEPVKNSWTRWLETDEILAFLHGGFRQHEKIDSNKVGSEFERGTSISLGMGLVRTFHMI